MRLASGWCAACCSVMQAAVDELLHHGVVARHPRDSGPRARGSTRLSPTCTTSVPCACTRTATAVAPGPARGDSARAHEVHAAARLLDGLLEQLARRRAVCGLVEDLEDCRHRELGGLAARGVPAHPVAHDAQVPEARLAVAAGVLVDLLVRIATGIGALRVLHGG